MKFLHNHVSDSCVHAYNEERLSIMNAKGHAGMVFVLNVKKFMNELGHLSDIFFLLKGTRPNLQYCILAGDHNGGMSTYELRGRDMVGSRQRNYFY